MRRHCTRGIDFAIADRMQPERSTRETLGLTRGEFAVLRRLRTPEKIQAFLYGLKQNFEQRGETCSSVRTDPLSAP